MTCATAPDVDILPPYFNEYRKSKSFEEANYTPKKRMLEIQLVYSRVFIPIAIESELEKAIDESKSILNLEYSWDDEGASPISKVAYNRAIKFLRNYNQYLNKKNIDFKIPEISPVGDGSVDLEWHLPNSYLLINFKGIDREIAYFYGNFNGKLDVKGKIKLEAVVDEFATDLASLS